MAENIEELYRKLQRGLNIISGKETSVLKSDLDAKDGEIQLGFSWVNKINRETVQ